MVRGEDDEGVENLCVFVPLRERMGCCKKFTQQDESSVEKISNVYLRDFYRHEFSPSPARTNPSTATRQEHGEGSYCGDDD